MWRDSFSPKWSDSIPFLQGAPENQKGEHVQDPQGSEEARTCLKEVWGAALAPVSSRNSSQLKSVSSMLEPSSAQKQKRKIKKKIKNERKRSSLKHSQRRQKLCQRVQGENSNQYKHQQKGKQKACSKDLCFDQLLLCFQQTLGL